MSFDSAEFAWNSVDVTGNDGVLRNGRVIDAEDGGLVVHFGGIGHSGCRLVPFDRIHHRYYSSYRIHSSCAVEVLLRVSATDPWKWYPGLVLHDFGLVSVSSPDRQLQGIVVAERIRERSTVESLQRLRVWKGQFVSKMVVVPCALGASDDQVIATFNAFCRYHNSWMLATRVLCSPFGGAFKQLVIVTIGDPIDWPEYYYTRKPCPDSLCMLLSLLKSGNDPFESMRLPLPALPYPADAIHPLVHDPAFLPQIFECLTTMQQATLRGVCRQWNAFLTLVTFRRIITISAPRPGADYTRSVFRFASCLYNSWNQHTKIVVLCGGNTDDVDVCPMRSVAEFVQRVVAEKALPDTAVLLLAREWYLPVSAANWVSAVWDIVQPLAGVCQRVVLKNAVLRVCLQMSTRNSSQSVVIRFSGQRIFRQLTLVDLWTMLNDGLRELIASDVERLAEWITKNTDTMTVPWEIARVLNITQTLDTRDGVRYRGISFRSSGFAGLDGVDVRHLTKLTQHALLQRLASDTCTIVYHIL